MSTTIDLTKERSLLVELLARDGFTVPRQDAGLRRTTGEPTAAGAPQRRFWVQERAAGVPGLNTLGCLARLGRPIRPRALEAAFATLFDRHEALRTRFAAAADDEGDAGDVIERADVSSPAPIELLDGGPQDPAVLEAALARRLTMETGPLWRAARFRAPDAADAVLLIVHHAIMDWAGVQRLVLELELLLEADATGAPSLLPASPLQPADHHRRRASAAVQQQIDADRSYWRARLAGQPPELALPAARPRSRTFGARCVHLPIAFDPAMTRAIRRFAAAQQSTPFIVLLAAYAGVLGRFAVSEDVSIGTAVDHRTPGADAIVGCLSDLIALRCDLSGCPGLAELVRRLHQACARDFEHAAIGFAGILDAVAPRRRAEVAPLFQALFNFLPAMEGRGMPRLTPIPDRFARADLTLELAEDGDEITGRLEAREDVIPQPLAAALATAIGCVIRHGLAMPQAPVATLPLLDLAAATALLDRLNPAPLPLPLPSLGDLFVSRARCRPRDVALRHGDREIDNGTLLERSTALARVLLARGVHLGTPVAICLERSIELAIAAIAVVRAGGAILFLDPDHPGSRLARVVGDSGAPVLIAMDCPAWWSADASCTVVSPAPRPGADGDDPHGAELPLPAVGPDDAAYLVFTSGSTGQPKGVVGLHRGMVNRILWMERAFPVGPGELACQKTSPSFVDFIAELFGPLIWGLPSVILARETVHDPAALARVIERERITRIVLVPSLLRAILDQVPEPGAMLASLGLCVSSGEALPVGLARRFRGAVPGCRLLNLYGSSEVSADATWYEVEDRIPDPMPIGWPIPGNRIAVTDALGQALPIGAPGEIAIGGVGVARGYLGGEASAAARFGEVRALASDGRAFRSGDLGLWDDRGRLIYLGRLDRQVKIQGVRVEPREIEATLESHPGVRACHVVAETSDAGMTVLTAYVAGDRAVTPGSLRVFLAGRLPRALIPSSFVVLDELPLGSSGKIDRAALPKPAPGAAGGSADGPRGALDPVESLVAEIWSDILGKPIETVAADFFACGGGSLEAIMAMTRLGAAIGSTVPVSLVFEYPVLGDLARRVVDPDREALPPPIRDAGLGPAPTTANQLWLWQEYCQDPKRTAYNLTIAYHLEGPLDGEALEAALRGIWTRHEALRTRLAQLDGKLVQIIDEVPAVVVRHHELADLRDPDAALAAILSAAERRPFALDRELPFRAELARVRRDRHTLLLTLHHVASDGWSGQILMAELSALYRAAVDRAPALPPPALQLSDVARWQQRNHAPLARWVERYRRSLAGATAPRLAGVHREGLAGGPVARMPVAVAPAALAAFERLGREAHATRFLLMLTAWTVLLGRFGGTARPILGFPQAGRNVPGLSSVVGFLANTILLAVDLEDASTFGTALAATRRALLEAIRHQDVPISWIQATGAGWPTGGGAVRSMVIVEDAADWALALPGIATRLVALPGSPEARVDLALVVTETEGGPTLQIEHAVRRVPVDVAGSLARGLERLIAQVAADPDGRLDPLPEVPPNGVASAVSSAVLAGADPRPAPTRLDDLLRSAAHATVTAVTDLRRSMTYAELDDRAAGVAAQLGRIGVGAGDRVALVADPSLPQVAGLFGIWRAGAIAVPIDPAYPRDRIHWLLADACVAAVLTDMPLDYPCLRLRLSDPRQEQGKDPASGSHGDGPAALIYTSGTTGLPKGVVVGHAALCRLGVALAEAYGLARGDRVLQVVSPAFDVALSDVALALGAGATLVVPPRAAVMPGRTLARTLADAAITHLQVPAAVLAATTPGPLPALRVVAVGGEVCPPQTARRWSQGRRLFIAYGPCEATVTAALAPYREDAPAGSIGRPFCGATLAVVDPAGAPVPMGVAGELVIGGPGVALGYLGRPDLTAEKFEPDPHGPAGGRRYRTGDRARLEPDGTATFLGRLDRQVKLRGVRIEPGEIEAALAARPGVARAFVCVRDDALGERRLLAWVVGEPDARLDGDDLRREMKRSLPDPLVPSAIFVVADVPLTPGGKVDLDALAPVIEDQPAPAAAVARPAPDPGSLQQYLCGLWGEILGRSQVGLDHSFFEIGGHSLLVVRMHERLEQQLGIELPIGELFAHPTVRSLTTLLQRHLPDTPPPHPEPPTYDRRGQTGGRPVD